MAEPSPPPPVAPPPASPPLQQVDPRDRLLTDLRRAVGQGRGLAPIQDVATAVLAAMTCQPSNGSGLHVNTLTTWVRNSERMYRAVATAMTATLKIDLDQFCSRYSVELDERPPRGYKEKSLPATDSIAPDIELIQIEYDRLRPQVDEINRLTERIVYRLDEKHAWVTSSLSEPFLQADSADRHLRLKDKRYESVRKGAFLLFLLPTPELAKRVDEMTERQTRAEEALGVNLRWLARMRSEFVTQWLEKNVSEISAEAERHFDTHVQCWQLDAMPLTPVKHTVSLLVEGGEKAENIVRRVVMRYPRQQVRQLRVLPREESNELLPCFWHFVEHVARSRPQTPFTRQLLRRLRGVPDVAAGDHPGIGEEA